MNAQPVTGSSAAIPHAPRSIRQPGPPRAERVSLVSVGAVPVDTELPAGPILLDALAELVERGGFESACLTLSGGALGPFAYVIPSLSPDADHAAYYSDTVRPAGPSRLETGAVTVGFRDGKPFFHCHAIWTEPDGRRGCGHVMPDETAVAAPIRVRGAGIVGARFEVTPDPETGFGLFMPRPTGIVPPPGCRPAVALRLAPNQDLTDTLERVGAEAGFRRAVVNGGVASIIEARFVDAPPLEGFATELLVRSGTVRCAPDAGAPTALDVAIVDYLGTVREGRLMPGDNPVLMTFEGLLVQA